MHTPIIAPSRRRGHARRGFTLIEAIVIIVIIGIIASIIAPRLLNRIGQSKTAVAKANAAVIANAMNLFCADCKAPASGETITRSSAGCWSANHWVSIGIAVMWSTGTWKKPCTWPACRSMVRTRSTPTASRHLATIRAEIGSRGADFLSWRAYPYQGITAMIRWAEAPWAASIIAKSSISESFGVIPVRSFWQVDWTMKTSAPRIESS